MRIPFRGRWLETDCCCAKDSVQWGPCDRTGKCLSRTSEEWLHEWAWLQVKHPWRAFSGVGLLVLGLVWSGVFSSLWSWSLAFEAAHEMGARRRLVSASASTEVFGTRVARWLISTTHRVMVRPRWLSAGERKTVNAIHSITDLDYWRSKWENAVSNAPVPTIFFKTAWGYLKTAFTHFFMQTVELKPSSNMTRSTQFLTSEWVMWDSVVVKNMPALAVPWRWDYPPVHRGSLSQPHLNARVPLRRLQNLIKQTDGLRNNEYQKKNYFQNDEESTRMGFKGRTKQADHKVILTSGDDYEEFQPPIVDVKERRNEFFPTVPFSS